MRHAAPARRAAVALALLPVLAACGGTATPAATTTASPPASTASPPAGATTTPSATPSTTPSASTSPDAGTTQCRTTLQITVRGTTVTPAPATADVTAGCAVVLTITSDRSSEVHVHVAELEEPITAGRPLRLEFTPEQPGVYEVELHEPELLLVKLAVR